MGTTSSVRKAIVKVNQNVMLTVYLGTDQGGLNGSAWNKINLNTVLYDVGTNFDTSLYKFTAPVAGLYHIKGVVHFSSVITAKRYMTAIYKNGAALKYAYQHAGLAADLSVAVDVEVFLEENDYIELYAQPEVGNGTNTVAAVSGTGYTELNVRLITKEGRKQ